MTDDINDASHPVVRPLDAATLIIVDYEADQPTILMGRRDPRHVFMPGMFVFPGGRVDLGDARTRVAAPLRPEVEHLLARGIPPSRARALGLSALRETFEETGLALGRARTPQDPLPRTPVWRRYYEAGAIPSLDQLDLIARAITPPGKIRRFDTRFFLTDAKHIQTQRRAIEGSGELLELHWLTTEKARHLELPDITRFVIGLVESHVKARNEGLPRPPIPYFRTFRGKVKRTML